MITLVDNKSLWTNFLQKCKEYDFYHTYDYNTMLDSSTSHLIAYEKNDILILIPILLRSIPGTVCYDVTSVYGYAGPISNLNISELPKDILKDFSIALVELFRDLKVVSAFSRLHTLISQESLFNYLGEVKELNQTVAIDLRISPEHQVSQYNKSTKYEISRLKKLGFSVRKTKDNNDLDRFIRLYNGTMERVNAKQEYFFNRGYYEKLLSSEDFNAFMLFAELGTELTAASFFITSNQFMQYHLSGSDEKYARLAPTKLIIDEARLIGNALGLKYLHLGGGYSGSNDSLFRFKTSFSENIFTYKFWKCIVDGQKYSELVEEKFGTNIPDVNFFPLYRYNPEK